jgi:hypothetical protein
MNKAYWFTLTWLEWTNVLRQELWILHKVELQEMSDPPVAMYLSLWVDVEDSTDSCLTSFISMN